MRHTGRAWAVLGVVGVLLGVVSAAPAGTGTEGAADSLYLDLGALYPSVGRVDFHVGAASYIGSATLIDSTWALTAAHVVDEATALSFTIGGEPYAAAGWFPHPKWDGDLTKGYDIGLIQLGRPISGIEAAALYTGRSEQGGVATAVGYGMTGTGTTGATSLDGEKRAGNNVVDAFLKTPGKYDRILLMDFDSGNPADNALADAGSDPDPLDLEYLIAPGDSGGGLFLDLDGDQIGDALAGVNSFVWGRLDGDPDSDYGDVSGHTRVSVFADWIHGFLAPANGGNENDGGKPLWAGGPGGKPKTNGTPTPEPATLALLLAGASILLRHRGADPTGR